MEKNKRRSKDSGARSENRDRADVESGLAIEAGWKKWLAIARHAGRDPEPRAGCFTSDLALAEEISAEEKLLVKSASTWSAAHFSDVHTAGRPDFTKGSEHYVVRYRTNGETRVLKATIPGKFGRYEYTPTIYLNSLRLLNRFVSALDIRIHGIRVAADGKPSIVTSMQYIKGRHPKTKQVENYLFDLRWIRFQDKSETLDFEHKGLRQIIRDAHPRNWVYQVATKSMVPIDVSIEQY